MSEAEVRDLVAREIEAERDARVPWPPDMELIRRGASVPVLLAARSIYDEAARVARSGRP